MWLGLWSVEVVESPKSHAQEVGAPVEVSVKVTARGATPPFEDSVKFATGAGGFVTMTSLIFVLVSKPPLLVAVRLTV